MPQKKIIDISIGPIAQDISPTRHDVILTYGDHTEMEIRMNGKRANVSTNSR